MKHALVIENNHIIALMVQEELIGYGYESEIATTQQQAIALAEARCPDLITVDQKLDSGTGVEAIRKICNGRAIPVVFVVAHMDQAALGIPDAIIILKPFSAAQLGAAIERAVCAPLHFQ